MDTTSRLYSQVAAMASVSDQRVMLGCYLLDLSRSGKTLNEACALLRKERADVRSDARDWGVSFVDYTPADPLILQWVKDARGKWSLSHDGVIIATAYSDGEGAYQAMSAALTQGGRYFDGSSAEVACRRCSVALERECHNLFGVDDVLIRFTDAETLAPKIEPMAPIMRRALHS